MQFIPARGRKHALIGFEGDNLDIAIYPREGTETIFNMFTIYVHIIAIYPREGTETNDITNGAFEKEIAIYPREGTETTQGRIRV